MIYGKWKILYISISYNIFSVWHRCCMSAPLGTAPGSAKNLRNHQKTIARMEETMRISKLAADFTAVLGLFGAGYMLFILN